MEVIFRDKQVDVISDKLNLPKSCVSLILSNYSSYLQEKINAGETVKVLNICYIRNKNEDVDTNRETLAYISTNIARQMHTGSTTVLRVLTTLEDVIIADIKNGAGHCIRGLIRIRGIRDKDGNINVRIKKSTKYNGKPVYIVTLNSFRRKVGVGNAG